MSRLSECATVRGDAERVARALERYFRRLCGGEQSAQLLLFLTAGDFTVVREVVATLHDRFDSGGNIVMGIDWTPKGGPYPRFSGTLSVHEMDAGTSQLRLTGRYEPPLGVAGEVFDAAVGRRIARATAHDLLARLQASIESSND